MEPNSADVARRAHVSRQRGAERINMQTVADRAGVAVSSVSRVLSGHADVSDVMRHRVLDAVAMLGYEPDLLAQSMRRGATLTVGFVVGNISNPLFASIALGAEQDLRSDHYSMLLANSFGDPAMERSNIRLLSQRRVDGLLLSLIDETAEETAETITRTAIPTVLVDRDPSRFAHSSAVLSDHAGGISSAAETLIALGHRRIALVNGPVNIRPARERAAALRRACRRPDVTAVVRSGSFTEEHGATATTSLLAEPQRPTAIIAGSNQILVGVLHALRDAHLSIPEDISLITCDDIALSQFLRPAVATISRDPLLIGSTAAGLLREQMAGAEPRSVSLPTGFRQTESCGRPGVA